MPFWTKKPPLKELANAINKGDIDAVKSYIQKGGDVNKKSTKDGETYKDRPLRRAAAKGNIDIINALLSAGADTKRSLRAAANKEVVSILIGAGADPLQTEKYGQLPWYHAKGEAKDALADAMCNKVREEYERTRCSPEQNKSAQKIHTYLKKDYGQDYTNYENGTQQLSYETNFGRLMIKLLAAERGGIGHDPSQVPPVYQPLPTCPLPTYEQSQDAASAEASNVAPGDGGQRLIVGSHSATAVREQNNGRGTPPTK